MPYHADCNAWPGINWILWDFKSRACMHEPACTSDSLGFPIESMHAQAGMHIDLTKTPYLLARFGLLKCCSNWVGPKYTLIRTKRYAFLAWSRFRYSISCKIGPIPCIDLGAKVLQLTYQLNIAMYTQLYLVEDLKKKRQTKTKRN